MTSFFEKKKYDQLIIPFFLIFTYFNSLWDLEHACIYYFLMNMRVFIISQARFLFCIVQLTDAYPYMMFLSCISIE